MSVFMESVTRKRVKEASKKAPAKQAPALGSTSPTNPWSAAYSVLLHARTARASRVVDAKSFAEEAFELPCALQVSWKATAEATLDGLELRFAPAYYLDHELRGRSLRVWREQESQRTGFELKGKSAKSVEMVVSGVAQLVGTLGFGLAPLNDGDDLHFVFIAPVRVERLRTILGNAFNLALTALPEIVVGEFE